MATNKQTWSDRVYWNSPKEEEFVHIRAKQLGCSVSRYIRDCVIGELRSSRFVTALDAAPLPPESKLVVFESGEAIDTSKPITAADPKFKPEPKPKEGDLLKMITEKTYLNEDEN